MMTVRVCFLPKSYEFNFKYLKRRVFHLSHFLFWFILDKPEWLGVKINFVAQQQTPIGKHELIIWEQNFAFFVF